METDRDRMYDALKRISAYASPEKLRKNSERLYGLEPGEAISMAYENVIAEAKLALKGIKKPSPERQSDED